VATRLTGDRRLESQCRFCAGALGSVIMRHSTTHQLRVFAHLSCWLAADESRCGWSSHRPSATLS